MLFIKRILKKSSKPTRYQCTQCGKTFYKPGSRTVDFGDEIADVDCCPYCSGVFILV